MNRILQGRSFPIWLAEVKDVPTPAALPKYELHQYFETFREDFNTATLPHIKYYDYDTWEMQEYEKSKQQQAKNSTTAKLATDDEEQHRQLRKQRHQQQQLLTAASVRVKRADMERQAQLQAQMQAAFRTGDQETYRRLKALLEPTE